MRSLHTASRFMASRRVGSRNKASRNAGYGHKASRHMAFRYMGSRHTKTVPGNSPTRQTSPCLTTWHVARLRQAIWLFAA